MRKACHTRGFGVRDGKWAQLRGTAVPGNPRHTPAVSASAGTRSTVRSMTAPSATTSPEKPLFLDLEGVQSRYGFGKTKATELVQRPGFVKSVVLGMHRLPVAALEIWKLATALEGTVAEPAPPSPPVVVTPPAPGRPGRRPSTREVAA